MAGYNKYFLFFLVVISSFKALGGDIEWSGRYRFEGHYLMSSSFDGKNKKAFGLHHMTLTPHFVVADGLDIHSRFDMFQSYEGSQIGGLWGEKTLTNQTLQQSQPQTNFELTHLYLTYTQDYGVFLIGRFPIEFGLGMSYSAGEGLWDHWTSTRDAVGYKMMLGNFSVTPMVAKVSEGALSEDDDVTEIMGRLDYHNSSNDYDVALFFSKRLGDLKSQTSAQYFGDESVTQTSSADYFRFNVFYNQKFEEMNLAAEFGMMTGSNFGFESEGRNVEVAGLGFSLEWKWEPKESPWIWGTDLGFASGDNPETTNKYEGFIFNRNYDKSFLLFNYNLGQLDVLNGRLLGHYTGNGGRLGYDTSADHHINKVRNEADTAALSNVYYFSPYFDYEWSDRWFSRVRLTTALLYQTHVFDGTSAFHTIKTGSFLGTEVDFSLAYSPWKNFQWVNELGLLAPGEAFKGGDLGLSTSFHYGIRSKIAVEF